MPLRGLFKSCEPRRTRNAWDGVIHLVGDVCFQTNRPKAAPANWRKNVGKDAYQASGSYRVWEDKPPEKRYVCMLLCSQGKPPLKRPCLKLEIPF